MAPERIRGVIGAFGSVSAPSNNFCWRHPQRFHPSDPKLIASSATLREPSQLSEGLFSIGARVVVKDARPRSHHHAPS